MPNAPITPEYVADTLPPDLLAAIGEIVVRWGRVEWQFSNLLALAFDLPKDTGRALLIGAEINVLCATARTLTLTNRWIKDDGLRTEVAGLSEDIRKKSKSRNNHAHGVFGFDIEEPNSFARYLFKEPHHRIAPGAEKLHLPELQKLATEAKGLVDRTVDLTVRLKASRRKVK
jgi:hypothetical protein